MMKKLILFSMCLSFAVPCQARIIYVDANTPDNNDGSNWAHAYKCLQDALADAISSSNVNEIHVAQGIYKPDRSSADLNGSGDPAATFQLINGVALKGGYAGFGELDPDLRDIEVYKTILSGDLKGNDTEIAKAKIENLSFEESRADNSYHVVTATKCNETAILDGVIITGGDAHLHAGGRGGGMINLASSPTLNNCTFTENIGWIGGGGMFNGQNSSAKLTNCVFVSNGTEGNGGGILNDSSSPELIQCIFTGNLARGSGGGIHNDNSNPTLIGCMFRKNSARQRGGGMYDAGSNCLTLTNCVFKGNSSYDGGGMHNKNSHPIITNCTFTSNFASSGAGIANHQSNATVTDSNFTENSVNRPTGNGGGMYNEKSNLSITNCTFRRNKAPDGGGVANINSNGTVTKCTFIENSTSGHPNCGGAISNHGSNPIFTNCTFIKNSSAHGGGMENYVGSSPTLINCIFRENSASYAGGGIYNTRGGSSPKLKYCTFRANLAGRGGGMANFTSDRRDKKSNPTLTWCIFNKNSAKTFGGGMENSHCDPTISNCTFTDNSANFGGALFNAGSNAVLTNCIIWGNKDRNGADASAQVRGGATVRYTCVQGGWDGLSAHNTDADPCFAEPNNNDYHLKSQAGRWDPNSERWVQDEVTSPCIDAGDPNGPIGSEPLPNGGRVNMGAYGGTEEASKSYFGTPICAEPIPGAINGNSKVDLGFAIMAFE